MQCLRGSLQLLTKKRSEKGRTICEIGTASPPRHPRILHPVRTFTPPQRRTAAWPGGEEREKGRRPSQLRVLPLLANYRLPKGRTFIPKIKNYKKRDRQTNKVQQSQKRKKLFLFLHLFILNFLQHLLSSFNLTLLILRKNNIKNNSKHRCRNNTGTAEDQADRLWQMH